MTRVFQDVTKALRPSVVSVGSYRRSASRSPGARDSDVPEELRRFFGEDGLRRFFRNPPSRPGPEQRGLGTGVLVSADGHVLTNNHVIAGADEVTVTLDDERTLPATAVGADPETDLAVLDIDAEGLVPAELGDSDALEVGQWVLAMGSPFGLRQTITAGIISATGRANVGSFRRALAANDPGQGVRLRVERQWLRRYVYLKTED